MPRKYDHLLPPPVPCAALTIVTPSVFQVWPNAALRGKHFCPAHMPRSKPSAPLTAPRHILPTQHA